MDNKRMRACSLQYLFICTFVSANFAPFVGAEQRPNVLFLAVDDMKDWVNCLGGYEGTVYTPNIDRLAKRGTLFTNAHCASPKCAPSRAAIMTGLRPSTTGLYDNVLPRVSEDDLDDLPAEGLKFAKARRSDFETIKEAGKWKHAVRAYLASITCADERLGRVLDALDDSPHAKNTIVILWSDHGWHLGEKQHWHKTTLWEEATRVPLVISAPGLQPGVCYRPVSLLDLYPTLNELTGLKTIEAHDGVSLTPLLRDPQAEWKRPAVIEFRRGNAAVRSDRYRYIRYHDGGEELYDHKTDPHEWYNLAASKEHQAIKQELAGWIAKEWAKSAPTKSAFRFDPHAFTWTNKKTGKVTHGKQQR